MKALSLNYVRKTGDLSRAPGAGPGLRGLGFRDRALGSRGPPYIVTRDASGQEVGLIAWRLGFSSRVLGGGLLGGIPYKPLSY